MELTLKNVGIIKDSTIKLDGLTVITGPNNSGKSTAGKALYSIIEGASNVAEKREKELTLLFSRILWNINRTLNLSAISRDIDISSFDERDREWVEFFEGDWHGFSNLNDAETKYFELKHFLDELSVEKIMSAACKSKSDWTKRFKTYLSNFDEVLQNSRKYLARLDNFMDDPTYDKYIRNNLLNLFREEFKGQVYPIKNSVKDKEDRKSRITLARNEEIGCDITIVDNEKISNAGRLFNNPFYQDVYYIDDPYEIDRMAVTEGRIIFVRGNDFDSSHSKKLQSALLSKNITPIEQAIAEAEYEHILESLNPVVPGDVIEKNGAYYYVEDKTPPLRIENLATGSKMFAIIKSLIAKGKITLNTMLILDEPEAHLHPAWQNLFAQFIITLIKEYGVAVLLTTHSPNFLMALDTFSSVNNIIEKTNFYHVKHLDDDYMIEYKNINGHLSEAYSSFTEPLIELQTKKKE